MKVHLRVAQPCSVSRFAVRTASRWSDAFGQVARLILLCAVVTGCGGYVQRHADRGDVYFKDQKYREAVAEYGKAIRFSADNPRILRQLGLAHLHLGEAQDAFPYLTKSE